MKYKTSKCKLCGQSFLKYSSNDCFCSLTCNRESFLNNFNQFEEQFDKEFNTTKEVTFSVILIVFLFMTGFYMYAGLN